MNYIFPILLGLSQIIIFPQLSFRWAKEITFQVLMMTVLCNLMWFKNKWLTMFVMWSIFLFFLGKNIIINDVGTNITYNLNANALLNIINVVLIGIFYICLHNIKLDKILIYKTLCFVGVFQSLYIFLQKLQLDQFFYSISLYTGPNPPKICWPVGTLANESLVAWCIALCSPFFLYFKDLRFKIGYFVCFLAILCTKTSAGLVGFVIGFLFWLWHKSRKLTIILIMCILILGGILYGTGRLSYYLQDTHRFKVWQKSIEIWREKPITGWGIGSYRVVFWEKAPEFHTDGHWGQAHNEYIQILFEEGIIGFGIVVCLIFTTALSYFRKRKGLIPLTSLIIACIVSLTSFPFHTSMGAIIILSLVLFERELCEEAI